MKYVLHVIMYIISGILLISTIGNLATLGTNVNSYPEEGITATVTSFILCLLILIFTIGTRKVIYTKTGEFNESDTLDIEQANIARHPKVNAFQMVLGSVIALFGFLFSIIMSVMGFSGATDINSTFESNSIVPYIIASIFTVIGITLIIYPIMVIYKSGRVIKQKN